MNSHNLLFLSCKGTHIIDESGKIIYLRGVCFGNEVWHNETIPENHHNEYDYKRIRSWGMNVVRFYLHHGRLTDTKTPGTLAKKAVAWLDKNVMWAKQHNIYLILNMHIPPGGNQGRGQGEALWDDIHNREQLRLLWRLIASRYAGEPAIAGYGILNQPVPNESMSQWQTLAQSIVNDIRHVDKDHIIFVERAISVRDHNREDANYNFPVIKDGNIVYEFHITQPYNYTRQLLHYMGTGDGGHYPDEGLTHPVNEAQVYDISRAPVFPRDKAYLEAAITTYTRWAASQSAPAYMGEFSTCIHSFQHNKGGLAWVRDVMDIAHEKKVHYTYHAYHDAYFGIFLKEGKLPDITMINQPLMELIKERLL
jgi:hypothetical protein